LKSHPKGDLLSESWIFDHPYYGEINKAREPVVRQIAPVLGVSGARRPTAIDVACGLGYYSKVLDSLGFEVLGVDARKANVDEARRRYPGLRFEVFDAEDSRLSQLGTFDLVFCFGLLYHLENPFRTIRSLSAMTSNSVMIEGICYPSPEPVMVLMDEYESLDQGINRVAFYPSELCIVKMLLRAGFSECYLPTRMPEHEEYRSDLLGLRKRTLLVGSKLPLTSDLLTPWPEPPVILDPHPVTKVAPLCPIRGNSGRLHVLIELLFHGRLGSPRPRGAVVEQKHA
jgi:SAM-dependent methyltransferase